MAQFKRTVCALLAVLMVFTTMTVAFAVVSSAAEDRIPTVNPMVKLTVPQYLQSHGDRGYERGRKINGGGTIFLQVPGGAENLNVTCSSTGVSLDGPVFGTDTYTWTVQPGTLDFDPVASSVVKWTVTYRSKVDGMQYTSYAWSAIKLAYADPGLATNTHNNNFWATHETYNSHIEVVEPVIGKTLTAPNNDYTLCYADVTGGNYVADAASEAKTATYWTESNDKNSSQDWTSAAAPGGDIYVDISQVTAVESLSLQAKATTAAYRRDESTHPQYYSGASIVSQTIGGSATSNFSITNNGTGKRSFGEFGYSPITGSLVTGVTPGDDIVIKPRVEWEGNVSGAVSSRLTSKQDYVITIHTYDKTALKTELETATRLNIQESQMYAAKPSSVSDPQNKFRSWSQYMSALQTAWTVYGREDVTQSQIISAVDNLKACYDENYIGVDNPNWVKGMMYQPANYTQIDALKNTIPDDFNNAVYPDDNGTKGLYYKYSVASELNDVIEDIESDRPLDSRYQGVVNKMKNNLNAAIANLKDSNGIGKYKTAYVHFVDNGTGVSGVPADTQAALFGRAYAPADIPERNYFSFTGWFFDAEATQPVSWPVTINPNASNFVGNLYAKEDTVGVAVNVYAGWNQTGKTLNFDSQGGSVIEPVIGAQGDPFTPTSDQEPTKPGYIFDCWCTDNTLTTEVDWSTFTFGKYNTVYARYTRATIYVTFDANASDAQFPNGGKNMVASGLYGDRVTVPAIPSRANNAFMGWGGTATATPSQAINMDSYTFPSSNIKLYAIWNNSYRNYFVDYNDGSMPKVYSAQINTNISKPADPGERAGYVFSGEWYTDPSFTSESKVTFPYRMGAEAVTFYAKWNANVVNIDFSANGGTMPASFRASDYIGLSVGDPLNFPDEPTLPGYVFVGWGLTDDATEDEIITFTTVPPQYTTLYAVWKVEPFTAKFRLATDAGSTLKQGQIVNVTVYLSANFIVSSNSFIVYYDNRYFTPALNGATYLTQAVSSSACTRTPETKPAFFTVINNPGGNVTDCSPNPGGRVNTGNSGAQVRQYFPSQWQEDNTTLKSEYSMYEYVYFSAADSSNGTRMQPTTEQAIATFQLRVKDDAPLVDGSSNFASIFTLPDFNRTAVASSKGLMAQRETQTAWDGAAYYDCEYRVTNPEFRFAVQEQETVQVSFVTKGGNSMAPVNAPVGQNYTPTEPRQSYYEFVGWSFTDSETADIFKSFIVPDHNVTLYAHWRGAPASYTVVHHIQNLNGGFDIQTETLQAPVGDTVYAQPLTLEGFNEPDGDNGVVVGDPAYALELDLWYYRKQTTVTLNGNGGFFAGDRSKTTVTLPQGIYGSTLVNTAGTPARDGYTFSGWTYNGAAYTFATYPASNITVYANWTVNTYTINFYLNDVLYATISTAYGEAISAPTLDPGDMVFSGWKSASGQYFNYTSMPADPITDFYGTLRSSGVQLTVAIRTKVNGTFVVTQTFVAVNAPVGTTVYESDLGYTTPEGYKTIVWRDGETAGSRTVRFPLTLNEDMTIYGTLEPKSITITMMYSVLGEDYEWYADVTGTYGEAYTREPDPDDFPADMFGFDGWYTDEALTQRYEWPATMPSEDITVYGKLYVLEGKVTFDANGGEGNPPAAITAEVGETVTLPGAGSLTRKYYKFGGWSLTASGSTPVTTVDIEDASTIKVYAIWTVNYATLNFDLNDADSGTRPSTQRVELGEAFTAFPDGADFVRNGFLFLGWATTRDAREPLTSYTATTTGNKTLYAVWAALSVELKAVDGSTSVIDDENHIIYGLTTRPTQAVLDQNYLEVVGNGHLNYKSDDGTIGTGVEVDLINDYTGSVDATYTIVIIGDLNGDGVINNGDFAILKGAIVGSTVYEVGTPEFFAADLNGDGAINNGDLGIMKSLIVGSVTLNQATRDLIAV